MLNARQAACQFGLICSPEFVTLTEQSLATISKLEKHHGHLLNWYDTQTLEKLSHAPFISSVDSGNLVASLHTLHMGARDLLHRPLVSLPLFTSLHAFWRIMHDHKDLPSSIGSLSLPNPSATLRQWIDWLPAAQNRFNEAIATDISHSLQTGDSNWWLTETHQRLTSICTLINDYAPWLHPSYSALRELPDLGIGQVAESISIGDAVFFSEKLDAKLTLLSQTMPNGHPQAAAVEQLRGQISAADGNLKALAAGLQTIVASAEGLTDRMEFGFLVDPGRQLLSIGYDLGADKLHEACYDMLASEARIATFLAIARGELPQESWFKLGRDQTLAFGKFLLLSWTGTMFEYLMPALWMRRYHDTLIARTLDACVCVQRAFARMLHVPWGISELGASRKDDAGHYQYQAYGIPQLALSSEATAGPVISREFLSFLALGVDSLAAIHNLRRMASAGWVGSFGFYEAADFSFLKSYPRSRMDGAPPGHVAPCHSQLAQRQHCAAMVSCQSAGPGNGASLARNAGA